MKLSNALRQSLFLVPMILCAAVPATANGAVHATITEATGSRETGIIHIAGEASCTAAYPILKDGCAPGEQGWPEVQVTVGSPAVGYNGAGECTGNEKVGVLAPSGTSFTFSTDVYVEYGEPIALCITEHTTYSGISPSCLPEFKYSVRQELCKKELRNAEIDVGGPIGITWSGKTKLELQKEAREAKLCQTWQTNYKSRLKALKTAKRGLAKARRERDHTSGQINYWSAQVRTKAQKVSAAERIAKRYCG